MDGEQPSGVGDDGERAISAAASLPRDSKRCELYLKSESVAVVARAQGVVVAAHCVGCGL